MAGILSLALLFSFAGIDLAGFSGSEPDSSGGKPRLIRIDFDDIDVGHGRLAAHFYLRRRGIALEDATPGTLVAIFAAKSFYDGRALLAPSPPNVLTQINSNDPVSFALVFPGPVRAVRFTRPALLAGPTGITFPEWKATARGAGKEPIAATGEPPRGYYANEPARTFRLEGQGIRSVLFQSKNHHFAAFSALVIDDLILEMEGPAGGGP